MKSIIILSVIVIAAILTNAYFLSGGMQRLNKIPFEKSASWDPSKPVKPELPDFARKTGRVAEAYIFAVQNQGYSLKDVRKKIDDEYSGRGAGTNTSLPP